MDSWKYFAIGHEHHLICNPTSQAKLDEIVELLSLSGQARVLDVGCGKGELLIRVAARWKCRAIGIDISPNFVADARRRAKAAGVDRLVEIVQGDGCQYEGEPASVDAAVCLGASWIWNGFEGTLRALSNWTKPGGVIVAGEPFWRRTPSPEYLAAAKVSASTFSTHAGNVEIGIRAGLGFLHAIVSNDDDWDHYEGYQWYAAERYAREHPDDPDITDLLVRMREARDSYLRWGRDEMGWAVYLFVKDSGA